MKSYDVLCHNIEHKIEEKKRENRAKKIKIQKSASFVICLVLLTGVAFSVSYGLNIREPSLIETDDSGSGAHSDSEGSVENNDSKDEVDGVYTPDSLTGPVTYKNDDGTYSWEEGKNYADAAGGTPYTCPEGHLSWIPCGFHSYPASLYAYVMNDPTLENIDSFYKARGNLENYTIKFRCNGFTILSFIQDYGITREEFDENVDLVEYYGYNLDVLFSGDDEAISDYYLYRTVFDRRSECTASYNSVISAIMRKYDVVNRADEIGLILKVGGFSRLFGYSIPELVYLLDIPRDELELIIEESEILGSHKLSYDYDFSVIYNEDGTIREELAALDLTSNDKDDIVKFSAHLGELFCRIYDWEDAASFGDDTQIEDIVGGNYYVNRCYCMIKMVHEYVMNRYGWTPTYFSEDVTSKECPLRAMLDEYKVTREQFEEHIDFAKYGIPEDHIDILYYGTAQEILDYFSHDMPLNYHREYKYKNISFSHLITFICRYYPASDGKMLYFDSIPEMVINADISREELEAIIIEIEKRESPTQIYYGGAFCSYDYDLDVIYNEDGSFKDLSEYDDDTLNDMFCRIVSSVK